MNLSRAKIFRKEKTLVYRSYSEDEDYFDFIAEQNQDGYSQFIISSKIMIYLIKCLVVDEKFTLKEIQLMESDGILDDEINHLIENVRNGNVFELIDKLRWLSDDNSIDVEMVHFSKRYEGHSIVLKIQANGIIFIDPMHFEGQMKNITQLISDVQV
ncbi:hypothetical protein [Levilactobacillus brevis]|uniref:hypothetical protein n=1 Tax=Levilactobacillus brevis TaxID=1580 RepID=UPI0021C88401|nr:hypothetical protein [Levilactobacillus brevis]MCU0199887.1 hypothetical protein [Levilactobacillus brevis]